MKKPRSNEPSSLRGDTEASFVPPQNYRCNRLEALSARAAVMKSESLILRLQFDREQQALLVTMGTLVTEESVTAARSAVHLFLKVQDPRTVIADLSLVEHITVSPDFVRYIATGPSALRPGRLVVLIAPKDATYGMSRMYQILRNTPNIEVVHSMKEALGLLGLKALNFERAISARLRSSHLTSVSAKPQRRTKQRSA